MVGILFVFVFFYFFHLVHPLVLAGSKSSGRKGQPQFLEGSAETGPAGQGRARPGETCILRIFDGRVVWVPVFHRLQFAFLLFFTEFVLEGVYIFWGSAVLVDWALLSLPPLKKAP